MRNMAGRRPPNCPCPPSQALSSTRVSTTGESEDEEPSPSEESPVEGSESPTEESAADESDKSSAEANKSSPETEKSSPEIDKSSPETEKSSSEIDKSSAEADKSSPESDKSSADDESTVKDSKMAATTTTTTTRRPSRKLKIKREKKKLSEEEMMKMLKTFYYGPSEDEPKPAIEPLQPGYAVPTTKTTVFRDLFVRRAIEAKWKSRIPEEILKIEHTKENVIWKETTASLLRKFVTKNKDLIKDRNVKFVKIDKSTVDDLEFEGEGKTDKD